MNAKDTEYSFINIDYENTSPNDVEMTAHLVRLRESELQDILARSIFRFKFISDLVKRPTGDFKEFYKNSIKGELDNFVRMPSKDAAKSDIVDEVCGHLEGFHANAKAFDFYDTELSNSFNNAQNFCTSIKVTDKHANDEL